MSYFNNKSPHTSLGAVPQCIKVTFISVHPAPQISTGCLPMLTSAKLKRPCWRCAPWEGGAWPWVLCHPYATLEAWGAGPDLSLPCAAFLRKGERWITILQAWY